MRAISITTVKDMNVIPRSELFHEDRAMDFELLF